MTESEDAIRAECLELARAYWPEDDVRVVVVKAGEPKLVEAWIRPQHGEPFVTIGGGRTVRTVLLALRDALRRLTGVVAEGMTPRDQRDRLWQLLDDIDTLDDSCREHDAEFRERVRAVQKKRWAIWNPTVER